MKRVPSAPRRRPVSPQFLSSLFSAQDPSDTESSEEELTSEESASNAEEPQSKPSAFSCKARSEEAAPEVVEVARQVSKRDGDDLVDVSPCTEILDSRRESWSRIFRDSMASWGDKPPVAPSELSSGMLSPEIERMLSLKPRFSERTEWPAPLGLFGEKKAFLFLRDWNDLPALQTASVKAIQEGNVGKSSAQNMSSEIIQRIYRLLHPRDFNAARRTCRLWFDASLDGLLLLQMLKRGGWWSTYARSTVRNLKTPLSTMYNQSGVVWTMSCSLSRECLLSGGRPVFEMEPLVAEPIKLCSHHWGQRTLHGCDSLRRSLIKHRQFRQTAQICFRELTTEFSDLKDFTFVTNAGADHLLVAEGNMIHAYELSGDSIKEFGSLRCSARVLAMSLDVVCKEITIAAILEGRLGLRTKLLQGQHTSSKQSGQPLGYMTETSIGHQHKPVHSLTATRIPAQDRDLLPDMVTAVGRVVTGPGSGNKQLLSPRTWKGKEKAESIFEESGPQMLFHNLCTQNDPPRSVAMHPKNSCIAFGCTSGFEMHWLDSVTQRQMSCWFPLAGPSDHLFFLPPQRGIDASSKLRMLSSVAHPSQRRAIQSKFYTKAAEGSSIASSACWFQIDFDDYRIPSFMRFWSDSNHYHALPLGDGFHCLFIEPASGRLCLGCAPLDGIRRGLVPKLIFMPPVDGLVPQIYTVSPDSSKGIRIAALYGNHIQLFSVPADIFNLSLKEQQKHGMYDVEVQRAQKWLEWWPEDNLPTTNPSSSPMSGLPPTRRPDEIWPLLIHGVRVGSVRNVSHIAVNDKTNRLTIWAFTKDGDAAV